MLRVLPLKHTAIDDLIFVDKPIGWPVHSTEFNRQGLVELYSEHLNLDLKVAHRLDKTTSGALVFAKTAEAAAILSALLENQDVQRKYIFLTDRKLPFAVNDLPLVVESFIEKQKNAFVSMDSKEPNSKTEFKFLKNVGAMGLWEARPQSGKPHQIRLHAEKLGIPVLGDIEHGGTASARIFLHSSSLEFSFKTTPIKFEAPFPFWSENFIESQVRVEEAISNRLRLLPFNEHPTESLRLCHREIDSFRIDQYGEQWWIYWYREALPNDEEIAVFDRLSTKYNKKYFIRHMLNRGEDPNTETSVASEEIGHRWIASENSMRYELRTDSGLSPGLFLDQREARLWVAQNAFEKRVLNLFSYTGGFSTVAAKSGATEVCTVDVSEKFLEWGKRNYAINGLNSEEEKFEFWAQDVILFLKGTYRRKRKFNLVICDPPSFGRSKNGTFSISKNFDELMTNILLCTEKNGLILFSTNYEKWTSGDLHLKMNNVKKEFSIKILQSPKSGPDFETPDQEPLMKSILIRKN